MELNSLNLYLFPKDLSKVSISCGNTLITGTYGADKFKEASSLNET
jgi:hypothetical protein